MKCVWNKGVKGYHFKKDKRIDNVNWEEVKNDLMNNIKTQIICSKHNISSPTLKKYINIKYPNFNLKEKMIKNMRHETKDGHTALYKKLRNEIKKGKHKCIQCGTIKKVEIHHKEKLQYDESFRNWAAPNFKNNTEDILFLCNSCHQKLHYRNLGKKSKVLHDKHNGRFVSNGIIS